MSSICAATKWATNAEMILDVVELGYIKPSDSVIDLTFGRGKWWSKYDHPGQFVGNIDPDLDFEAQTEVERMICALPFGFAAKVDYRHIRSDGWDDSFDVVVFDPPYVSMGGRATSTLPDFMDRFGLENAASTPELLQADNERGLAEAFRICKPGGLVLAKCAPYISSGVRKEGDWWTRDAALELGFEIHDMLIHLGDVRAQPKDNPCKKCEGKGWAPEFQTNNDPEGGCTKCDGTGRIPRKVKHARNNFSVLFVLRRPPVRKRRANRGAS